MENSPAIDQELKRVPVLVYETVRTGQHLHFFKRYRNELRFLGEVDFQPPIYLLLINAAWLLASQRLPSKMGLANFSLSDRGVRYRSMINDGLATIMDAAKLGGEYVVKEWFQKKGRLVVYVVKRDVKLQNQRESSPER